jgi:hypothetical protein
MSLFSSVKRMMGITTSCTCLKISLFESTADTIYTRVSPSTPTQCPAQDKLTVLIVLTTPIAPYTLSSSVSRIVSISTLSKLVSFVCDNPSFARRRYDSHLPHPLRQQTTCYHQKHGTPTNRPVNSVATGRSSSWNCSTMDSIEPLRRSRSVSSESLRRPVMELTLHSTVLFDSIVRKDARRMTSPTRGDRAVRTAQHVHHREISSNHECDIPDSLTTTMCVSAKAACTRTGSSGSSRAFPTAFECLAKFLRECESSSTQTNR